MKKSVSILLCLVLVLSMALSACGDSAEVVVVSTTGESTTVPATEPAQDNAATEPIAEDNVATEPTAEDSDATTPVGGLDGNISVDIETEFKPLVPDLEDINIPDLNIDYALPEHDFTIDLNGFDMDAFLEDAQLNFSPEDLAALQQMDPAELAKLIQIRASLLADLKYAFEKSGIAVYINEKTGEINLDATVLFDVDEYAVSDEGKKLLKTFMQVYTFVVYHERYNGFISGILIEGHTDSTGEYEYNQELSQKRADAVMEYILSDDCGMTPEHREAFRNSVTAKGYSWDRLIYDENGVEDKDASRRVAFRFLIDL